MLRPPNFMLCMFLACTFAFLQNCSQKYAMIHVSVRPVEGRMDSGIERNTISALGLRFKNKGLNGIRIRKVVESNYYILIPKDYDVDALSGLIESRGLFRLVAFEKAAPDGLQRRNVKGHFIVVDEAGVGSVSSRYSTAEATTVTIQLNGNGVKSLKALLQDHPHAQLCAAVDDLVLEECPLRLQSIQVDRVMVHLPHMTANEANDLVIEHADRLAYSSIHIIDRG